MSLTTYHRTGEDGIEHRLIIGVRGEHQAADAGHPRHQFATQLDSVSIGQTDVEHGDIGSERRDPGQRLRIRRRLSDYGEIRVRGEKFRDATAHDFVIVHEKDADHSATSAL